VQSAAFQHAANLCARAFDPCCRGLVVAAIRHQHRAHPPQAQIFANHLTRLQKEKSAAIHTANHRQTFAGGFAFAARGSKKKVRELMFPDVCKIGG
jgi:hypothetical protein